MNKQLTKKISEMKAVAKKKGITYSELCKLSGVPVPTITNIFIGKTANPRIDTVQAIERALGISDGWTKEERAAGVVDETRLNVNASQLEWLYLHDEILRVKGEAYLKTLKDMIEAIIEKSEKN